MFFKTIKTLSVISLSLGVTLASAGISVASNGVYGSELSEATSTTMKVPVGEYDTPAEQERLARELRSLSSGETTTIASAEGAVLVTKTDKGFAIAVPSTTDTTASPQASFCGVALATAIIGVGAGALGVLAAVTGGGTAVIAGVVLSGAQIGVLAGIATSYTAVLGWVSYNIC